MPAALALDALAWLLTYALHSTLLLGAAWWLCDRRRLRSERLREGIWKLALVGGIVTAGLQGALGFEPRGGLFALERAAHASDEAPSLLAGEASARPRDPVPTPGATEHHHLRHGELPAPPARRRPSGSAQPETRPAHGHTPAPAFADVSIDRLVDELPALAARLSWTDWALAGWAAGGSVLLGLLVLGALRLRDYLAGRVRLRDGALVESLERLRRAAGLRRPVRLMVSPRLEAPIALGTLRPQICVPPRALTELTPAMQEAMLAHELAHLARFDPLWLRTCRLLETLLFFQPLNRLARRRLAECAEFLCDDRAVRTTGDPLALARCLAEVAGWLTSADRGPTPRGSLCGMAERRSRLSERVTRILERGGEIERAGSGLVPLGAGVIGGFALLAPAFAREHVVQRDGAVPAVPVEALLLQAPASVPAPGASHPPDPLERLVLDLEQGLAGLELELAELRLSTSGLTLPDPMGRRMDSMQARAASLREKKQEIDSLLERLHEAAAPGEGNHVEEPQ